jgi:hypothetical protein
VMYTANSCLDRDITAFSVRFSYACNILRRNATEKQTTLQEPVQEKSGEKANNHCISALVPYSGLFAIPSEDVVTFLEQTHRHLPHSGEKLPSSKTSPIQ